MNDTERRTASRLEEVYEVFRKLQINHNEFETACSGTGNCCKVGLYISLAECWNIARNIKRQYFINAETKGYDYADKEIGWYIEKLMDAMVNETWDRDTQEQDDYCAFIDNRGFCSIYEFRPAVCRAYGVIAPVQDGHCHRPRLADGGHELIRNDGTDALVDIFDEIIEEWGKEFPDYNYSMYMPAGVLKFLLSQNELESLIRRTDEKFWWATEGYQHQMKRREFETPVAIK